MSMTPLGDVQKNQSRPLQNLACKIRTAARRVRENARCTGCRLFTPKCSIVVICLSRNARAGIRHVTQGALFTSTVHAPHTPAPHEYFVPVSPSVSRRTLVRRTVRRMCAVHFVAVDRCACFHGRAGKVCQRFDV